MAACGTSLEISENEENADRKSVEVVLNLGNQETEERKSLDHLDLSDEKKVRFEPVVERKKVRFGPMVEVKERTRIVSKDVNFWGKRIPMYVAKSIFQFFDKNDSGKLCKDQWHKFLQSYGMEEYTKEFAALVDADGCGEISWPEFKKWICRTNYFVHNGSKKAESKFDVLIALSEKFQSYDKDNNGYITIDEFTAVKDDWSYPTDTETFFRLVDKDGNNKITFNEYYHFFFHPYMKKYYPDVFDDMERCSNVSFGKTLRKEVLSPLSP